MSMPSKSAEGQLLRNMMLWPLLICHYSEFRAALPLNASMGFLWKLLFVCSFTLFWSTWMGISLNASMGLNGGLYETAFSIESLASSTWSFHHLFSFPIKPSLSYWLCTLLFLFSSTQRVINQISLNLQSVLTIRLHLHHYYISSIQKSLLPPYESPPAILFSQ